jgi:hypothetical protein
MSAVGVPSSGGAVVSGTTQVLYTPLLDVSGTAVFTYTATDGVFSNTANVTITVVPVNDGPAAMDDVATTPEDWPIALNVLANDSDVDSPTLVVAAVGQTLGGVATISGTTQLVFVPSPNFNGQAVFTYTTSDAELVDTAAVTVTVTPVNDPPTISEIGDLALTVGASSGPISFTVGDVESGGALTVTAASSNLSLVPIVNIQLGGIGADRAVTITPAANQAGQATITITVIDGDGGSAQESFILTVDFRRFFIPLVLR